ncbi:MAG: ParB N-terminal domain-containing protein [Deltaproteobacteria bacterium]|jgi:ParB/RepB/Spo0J family partition protein|nr:ParB N-terminal domain-containing protein [Deltaproteobacteria bacterium]
MENVQHVDCHQVIPRFASWRLHDPERLAQLVRSVAAHGQLTPVVVVPASAASADSPRWVLIDGYRRLAALQQIGEDRIWVDAWEGSVDEVLLLCLAKGAERGWEAMEQAALLHDLSERYTLRELAQRIGRDVSWVSRRLTLFQALPETLLDAVRDSRLSVWAATRILAPLARANSAHAETLLTALSKNPLSTRELQQLFEHYRQSPQAQRERLVADPGLFIRSLAAKQQAAADTQLAGGPEGVWHKDLGVIKGVLRRLIQQIPRLFSTQQPSAERTQLLKPYQQTQAEFHTLDQRLKQATGDDHT